MTNPGPLVSNLSGAFVVVVGLGGSGQAAARWCLGRGARVRGLDSRAREALPLAVRELGIELRLGEHRETDFEGADLVVVSPGVPPLAVLDVIERRGVPVIGELELASRAIHAPIVAVGGTNGKSTTTTLVACMLSGTGARVFSGGNLGEPASSATEQAYDYVVLEVSSFQLERAPSFHPRVSVLLNVSEDHLDRYPDYAAYVHAKGNAFANQRASDFAVVPAGDALCLEQARRGRAALLAFGAGGDYFVEGKRLIERTTGLGLDLERVPLHGRHNWDNLAAALASARALGLDFAAIERGLESFRPLPHRMQHVGVHRGVVYYDDSKGTNVGASVTAVSGLVEPCCVLIAGGRDKLGSYAPLVEALREKGRGLVVIGEAAERLAAAAEGAVPVLKAGSMDEAVARAASLAQPGDAVLLSPACSSFDMFSGYAERGRVFAAAVDSLAEAADS